MKNALLCLLAWSYSFASAQTGAIRGEVKTTDGSPAAYIHVVLVGTERGASTDDEGVFEIRSVTPGHHYINVSFVGMETQQLEVEVRAGETLTIPTITLRESIQELNEIVVNSNREKASPYVARMPLKDLENPQVYQAISSTLLKQQAITQYDDALKNVPGLHKLWESTGRGSGDGAAYYALRGFETQATMVNGLPGLTSGSLDPANIERIEVIKGPSGTLFGSSLISYGGLINTVTKKPHGGFRGEVGYTMGSFGLNRITADINMPIPSAKEVAVRINTAYHTENSFQNAGFRKFLFVAPSLSYKVSDRLSFLINTEFMEEEKTNPPMLFLGRSTPLQFPDLKALNYNRKLSLTSNDLSIHNPRFILQGQMNYVLSPAWTSQTVVSRGVMKSDGYYSYLYDNENDLGEFSLWISKQQAQTLTTDIQQNFIGDFKLGSLRNRVVVGLDYFSRNLIDNSTGYGWLHNVTPQGEVNFINPYTGVEQDPRYLTRTSVDNLLASTGQASSNTKASSYSAYVSDVINLTHQLLAMASLRVDYFDTEGDIRSDEDNYHQTALSPKFGILYQPIEDRLSVFANYMNGYKNVAPAQVADADGSNPRTKTFKPEHANQVEVGIKGNFFADRVNATVSYYDIQVANVVTADPTNLNNSLQGGEVESKGIEIDVQGQPLPGLTLLAGFSHNTSTVLRGDEANIWLETGRRPIAAGPRNLFNIWTNYRLHTPVLKGLGFGLGGNYVSTLSVLDSQVTGQFLLPDYFIVNAAVFYENQDVRIGLNLNNLTDVAYYTGYSTINPQKPRNVVASLSYTF